MKYYKVFRILIISILWVCMAQSCTPKKSIDRTDIQNENIIIDSSFNSLSLNEQVLVSTKFSEKELNRKDLKTWFKQNNEKVSQKKEAILIGNFKKYPHAWFYTQIVNKTNLSQKLVVDEFNRIRCDDFEVMTIKNGMSTKWGKINRSTPYSKYPIPYFTFAIPITIQPKDTINLLIYTQRHYGAHEVNLSISAYQTYLNQGILYFLSKIFEIFVYIVCVLVMLILGRMYRYNTMLYLGFYIISIIISHLAIWGFTDSWYSKIDFIALSGSNSGTFTTLVSFIFGYLFNAELMKVVPKNETVFNTITYSMIVLMMLVACCYCLPISVFNVVYSKIDLPVFLLIFMIIYLVWTLFCSIWAFIIVKIYYIFIGIGVACLPLLLQQFGIFNSSTSVLIRLNQPSFIVYVIGFTIISIFLLRNQLVSRKIHEKKLAFLKESLDEIRKNEISGIGRNLHDNVGNILATAFGYLNQPKTKVETVQNLIKEAITEIRFLSHSLVKNDNFPLKVKIERLVEHFNEFSEISYNFSDYSENLSNKLSKEQQTNLYFIIQELFTNTLKHSFATEVILQIFEDEKRIWLTVEDDGIGMKNRKTDEGIGLKNIDTRAKLAGFKIITDSSTQGTNTTIEIML